MGMGRQEEGEDPEVEPGPHSAISATVGKSLSLCLLFHLHVCLINGTSLWYGQAEQQVRADSGKVQRPVTTVERGSC